MVQTNAESKLPASGYFGLTLTQNQSLIGQYAASGIEGYVLGRSDESSPYVPDINLQEHDALDKGVSRRHAVLLSYRNVLHVMDLGSVNGTYLNGQRLRPDRPYPLHEGDELHLGSLNMALIKIK